MWVDADVITFNPISHEVLNILSPSSGHISYLGREYLDPKKYQTYSECGFMIFNLKNTLNTQFWDRFINIYLSLRVFELDEWHDSYVFDHIRTGLEDENSDHVNADITRFELLPLSNPEHVFAASALGNFMDHKKGNRKISPDHPKCLRD